MGLTAAQRRILSRKAADNSLEVEHLVKVAELGDASDAPFLRALKEEHSWSDTGREGRKVVVPFGRWADTVCFFLEDGYAGLVQAGKDSPDAAEFCVSVLEELKTAASVSAIVAIGGPVIEWPAADVNLAVRLVDGFNLLLSLTGAPAIAPLVERKVREFLHRLLAAELSEVQRASVVCALRGVGDAESVALVTSLPPRSNTILHSVFCQGWSPRESTMRVKLFWKNRPGSPNAGLFGLSFRNAQDLENEMNAWLLQNPKIKVVDIKQSASGGSFAPSLWLVSVWYEEAVETGITPERGGS